ncbi:MAG: histone deacetylase family protein, partial [Pseudomonadota bacterium]|nr:histone deacetylase family protein [Pseudomonadota bacterium]
MKIVYSDKHRNHFPQGELFGGEFGTPFDRPSRVEHILRRLRERKFTDFVAPGKFSMAAAKRIHDRGLLKFLETAWDQWMKAGYRGEIIPTGFPARRMRQREPRHIDGRV